MDTKITATPQEILSLRESGMTLQAIGDRYGVTRERIRQVIRKLLTKQEARTLAIDRYDAQSEATRAVQMKVREEKLAALGACQVCGRPILEGRVEIGFPRVAPDWTPKFRTCSPECREKWARGVRYGDPEVYRRHRLRMAEWMLKTGRAPETAQRIIEHDGRPFGRNTWKHRDQMCDPAHSQTPAPGVSSGEGDKDEN